ncbi:MAG TPA: tRNA (guanosine(46)-N7)-methyltransferase TrmB [Caulobacter sp.]|nr:tRNA (guanosine(46)-N7)-methyltransferase TrmB [Caulobacter sp.]
MPVTPQQPHGALRSYGRIKARPIKARQAEVLATVGPTIEIPQGPFDPRALRPDAREIWLEIGFGGGEHMAGQAERSPDVLIIGVEPFLNGVASAVRHVDDRGLTNVRIHQGDAREVAARLPDACLDRVFILFPDPWPKSRHHKRRIIQPEFIVELARLLKPGGGLRFATDWADYADWTRQRVPASGLFVPVEADTALPPADHLTTRYEEKRLGDCAPVFLDFVRV